MIRRAFLLPEYHFISGRTVPMFNSFNTKLAGVTFAECQQNINKWGYPDIGYFRLEREPDNLHDPNAVGVWFLNDRLGYLPRPVSKRLAPVIDVGEQLIAKLVCRNQIALDSIIGLTVRIMEDEKIKFGLQSQK
jgi:hypothetical protein